MQNKNDNILEQFKTLQIEGNLFAYLPGNYFTVWMIVNNKKTLIVDFLFAQPSLGTHFVHDISFCLRTQLLELTTSSDIVRKNFNALYKTCKNFIPVENKDSIKTSG